MRDGCRAKTVNRTLGREESDGAAIASAWRFGEEVKDIMASNLDQVVDVRTANQHVVLYGHRSR